MKVYSAWLLLLGMFASTAGGAAGTSPGQGRFERQALQADIAVLQEAYEALHPGLYRYNTPASTRAHFASLRKALDGPRSLADAYLALSRFAATVRCGHTYPNFYNQPRAIQQALFERDDRVPFRFRWLDGRMIVSEDFSGNPALRPGTEVLAIDGASTRDLLSRMLPMARADGGNDAKRVSQLEMQGTEKYEPFDVYLSLLLPANGPQRRYRVRAPGAAHASEITLPSLSYSTRLSQRRVPDEKGDAAAWTLDLSDPALGVLRMPSWALYDSRWDWKQFLQRSFEQLEQARVPALVIDLRGNEGGLDVGDVLLAHLLATPTTFREYRRRVRYRAVPAGLVPYLDTWDPSFRDWGDAARPYDRRFYALHREGDVDDNVIAPSAPRFRGRVFVLIGAANSSATFEFASRAKRAGVATLVGQATGGNRRGINGGAFFFLRLPNTGLEMDLPLIGLFPEGEEPDSGLQPDVQVRVTRDAIASGRDLELAAVRRLLAQQAPH